MKVTFTLYAKSHFFISRSSQYLHGSTKAKNSLHKLSSWIQKDVWIVLDFNIF